MSKLAFTALLLCFSFVGFSQFHGNIEVGGSNFWGISITGEYRIALYPKTENYQKSKFYVAPKVGVGHTFSPDKSLVTQLGLAVGLYQKRNANSFELNTNFSYLTKASLVRSTYENNPYITDPNYSGVYWCTGLDYKIKRSRFIYTIGVGVFTEIERFGPNDTWETAGGLPMLKLGIGI